MSTQNMWVFMPEVGNGVFIALNVTIDANTDPERAIELLTRALLGKEVPLGEALLKVVTRIRITPEGVEILPPPSELDK